MVWEKRGFGCSGQIGAKLLFGRWHDTQDQVSRCVEANK